jgi:small subunit ribosomal protein S20
VLWEAGLPRFYWQALDNAVRRRIVRPSNFEGKSAGTAPAEEKRKVANHASAAKRARQAEKIRTMNRANKSAMRTAIKEVLVAVSNGDKEAAAAALKTATSLLDRAGRKHLIHPGQASRRVSRLNARVKGMS